MPSERVLLTLIERIYDAAIAPELWPAFLDALAEVIDGHMVNLAFTDAAVVDTTLIFTSRFDPEAERKYRESYSSLDPWANIGAKRGLFKTGVVALGVSLLSHADYKKTVFYNEFGRICDLSGGVTAVIRADASVAAILNTSQRRGGRQFDDADVSLLRQLLPHLRRAFHVHERLAGLAQARAAAEDLIDRLPFGVVILDGHGRAIVVNRVAEQILDARDGLILRNRSLEAASGEQTAELRAMVAGAIAVARGERLESGSETLAVGRPSLKRPLQVLVTPLRTAAAALSLGRRTPVAAVFISDYEREHLPTDAILRKFYGLTPAETRLAMLLLQHKSLEEAAESLHISLNTVRTHLKSLFEKTGTRRQSELLRLLAGGVGQLHR
jgi:DNA-binding CsgD family transcriptional regulator/PAS domain-containing protein